MKSAAGLQNPAFPSTLADFETELLEAAFQGLLFTALPAGHGIGRRQAPQMLLYQSSQRGIPIDSNLPDLVYEIVVERNRYLHIHMIGESRIRARVGQEFSPQLRLAQA